MKLYRIAYSPERREEMGYGESRALDGDHEIRQGRMRSFLAEEILPQWMQLNEENEDMFYNWWAKNTRFVTPEDKASYFYYDNQEFYEYAAPILETEFNAVL